MVPNISRINPKSCRSAGVLFIGRKYYHFSCPARPAHPALFSVFGRDVMDSPTRPFGASLITDHATESQRITGDAKAWRGGKLVRKKNLLLELGVLGFRRDQDGDVGVGVFPEREEIIVGGLRFAGVARESVSTGEAEMGKCAQWEV